MYAFYCLGVEPRLYGPFETRREAEVQLRLAHMPLLDDQEDDDPYCENGVALDDHGIEELRSPRAATSRS